MWKIFSTFLLFGVVAGRVSRSYDAARFREALEAECKLNGGEDHVEQVIEAMITFNNCIYNNIDKEALQQLERAEDQDVPSILTNFVKKTCKSQSEINTCFNKMLDAFSPCCEPKERTNMYIAKQAVAEMTDLFCNDESKKFSVFINEGAISCAKEQFYPLQACVNKINSLKNYKTLSSTESCNEMEEFNSCILRAVKKCPKSSSVNFAEEFFGTIRKGSLCEVHSDEENEIANSNVGS